MSDENDVNLGLTSLAHAPCSFGRRKTRVQAGQISAPCWLHSRQPRRLYIISTPVWTRSQAVARIADRTASQQSADAHFQRKLFVRPLGIPHTKLRAKFEASSSSSFRDIAL